VSQRPFSHAWGSVLTKKEFEFGGKKKGNIENKTAYEVKTYGEGLSNVLGPTSRE
jgi:hypothetical protein